MSDTESDALRRAYVAADMPFVGFVTPEGITRIPPEIMALLGNKATTVAWSVRASGVFGMATIEALHAAEDCARER